MHRSIPNGMLAAFVVVNTACPSENELKNSENAVVQPRMVDCPIWTCDLWFEVDYEHLEQCYTYDEQTGWSAPPNTPMAELLAEYCSPPDADPDETCDGVLVHAEVNGDLINLVVDPNECDSGGLCCPCGEGAAGDPAPDNCCYDGEEDETFAWHVEHEWVYGNDYDADIDADADADTDADVDTYAYQAVVELAEQLEEDCGWDAVQEDPRDYYFDVECTNAGAAIGVLSEEECPAALAASLETGAAYILGVNPLYSYVTIHTATDEETVPLSGRGAVGASPSAFLVAIVDAADGAVAGTDLEDWRFWFSADIDINVSSGNFNVPHSQGYSIDGRGLVDDDWHNVVFNPTTTATGQFGTNSWYLNYYTTFTGGWVALHLEGTKVSAAP